MWCIATEPNQKRVSGKIRFFNTGETFEFEECPPHFEIIDQPPVDVNGSVEYGTMGEKWLRQYEGDPDKLAMFILETYKDAQIPPNATWKELVDILQVQRETNILMVDNTGKKENKLSSIEQTDTTINVTLNDINQYLKVAPAGTVTKPVKPKVTKKDTQVADSPAPVTPHKTEAKPVQDSTPTLSQSVEDELDSLFKGN